MFFQRYFVDLRLGNDLELLFIDQLSFVKVCQHPHHSEAIRSKLAAHQLPRGFGCHATRSDLKRGASSYSELE